MAENISDAISQGFLALSDKTRRDMLSRLVEGDLTIGALADNYEMSLPAVSKHVQILERAGFVEVLKVGREKRVKITFDNFDALQIWLASLGGSEGLFDRLEAELDTWET